MLKQIKRFSTNQYTLQLLVLVGCICSSAASAAEDLSVPPEFADKEVRASTVRHKSNRFSGMSLGKLLHFRYRNKSLKSDDGFKLVGRQELAIKVSPSMPISTYNCLRDGSGRHVNSIVSNDLTEGFVFVQKRW